MLARPASKKGLSTEPIFQLLNVYYFLTALILAIIGFLMLIVGWGDKELLPFLQQQDAIFAVSNRKMLLAAGLAHLILSGCLFITKDSKRRGLMILWVALNYIIYHIGMTWMHQVPPFAAVKLIGWKTGVNANALGALWDFLILYLAVGGAILIIFGWEKSGWTRDDVRLKRWIEIKREWSDSNSKTNTIVPKLPKLSASADDYVKMSCVLCEGHIAFPAQNVGQKIACPHCGGEITLMAKRFSDPPG